MKIVLAFDSFKGSLEAARACEAARDVLLAADPRLDVRLKPMADGGEGTAAAMIASLGGEWVRVRTMGPLPDREADAGFAWFPKERRALVEMASASGLPLLAPAERNPLRTTTWGTGQLLAAAFARRPACTWLAVGGSATVDGGVGAAMALGWRFLEEGGRAVGPGGAELERIRKIVPPRERAWPPVEVLCDVDNPLCGEHGAARTYGPQKGATPEMVERLESALGALGRLVKEQLGRDILDLPGAGAAGGLAAGAVAFLDAKLVSGIDAVIRASGLEAELAGADWVVTGEGSFDAQSLRGKVVAGVARAARRTGTKVAVLAGRVAVAPEEYRRHGVATALALHGPEMPLEEALRRNEELLRGAAAEFARRLVSGTLSESAGERLE